MSPFDVAGWLAAWSDGDLERALGFYAAECRYRDPATPDLLTGHAALRLHLEKVFRYWPEQSWEEVRRWEHADGRGITLLWRAGITSPRSGKSVHFEGLDVLRFDSGKITEQLIFFDPALWRGLMPAKPE